MARAEGPPPCSAWLVEDISNVCWTLCLGEQWEITWDRIGETWIAGSDGLEGSYHRVKEELESHSEPTRTMVQVSIYWGPTLCQIMCYVVGNTQSRLYGHYSPAT